MSDKYEIKLRKYTNEKFCALVIINGDNTRCRATRDCDTKSEAESAAGNMVAALIKEREATR